MSLFDDIVAASGLNEVVAPFTVSRLLVRADVAEPERVSRDDLARALPELERGIRVYLEDHEVDDAIARLRALVAA